MDHEKYVNLVNKGSAKKETYQKIHCGNFWIKYIFSLSIFLFFITLFYLFFFLILILLDLHRTFKNNLDFAQSVSQDMLARCLNAFAHLCMEAPGRAKEITYPSSSPPSPFPPSPSFFPLLPTPLSPLFIALNLGRKFACSLSLALPSQSLPHLHPPSLSSISSVATSVLPSHLTLPSYFLFCIYLKMWF